MEDNFVKIEFDSVYWNLQPIETEEPETGKPLIRFEWGWGAGLTDEQRIENEKDNVPAGYESVTTTLEGAAMLVSELLEILEKNKDKSKIVKTLINSIEGNQTKNENYED